MKSKLCNKCHLLKPVTEFYRNKNYIDGLRDHCKNCIHKEQKIYRKLNKEKIQLYNDTYRKINADRIKKYNAMYRLNNKNILRTKARIFRKNNKSLIHKYKQKYYYKLCKNPKAKLNHRFSSEINKALRGGKYNRHWEKLVGYTINDLFISIESKFLPGMTWDNRDLWHIHHIKFQSSFNFKTAEDPEFKKCWALSNLKPLWHSDHIKLHSNSDQE